MNATAGIESSDHHALPLMMTFQKLPFLCDHKMVGTKTEVQIYKHVRMDSKTWFAWCMFNKLYHIHV